MVLETSHYGISISWTDNVLLDPHQNLALTVPLLLVEREDSFHHHQNHSVWFANNWIKPKVFPSMTLTS